MPKPRKRARPRPGAALSETDRSDLEAMRSVKVSYSCRITFAADQQLKALAVQQQLSQVDLIAEALNLLFKKNGLPEVA
jgi:hypothetical protein